MKKAVFSVSNLLLVPLLALALVFAQCSFAQDHVVTSSDLQRNLADSSSQRQKNVAQLQNFISSPEAQKALKSAHIDATQVKNAIPKLGDEELAQLASRTTQAQKDFVAGRISDRDLIIILLAVVALILIIVAVR